MSVSEDERASPFGKRELRRPHHQTNWLVSRLNFITSRDREGDTVEKDSQEGGSAARSGSLGEAASVL